MASARAALTRRAAVAGGRAGILVFFVTFLAFPFYWMVITTFKTTRISTTPQTIRICSTTRQRWSTCAFSSRTLSTWSG